MPESTSRGEGVSAPRGGVCSGLMSAGGRCLLWGLCSGVVSAPGGVSAPRGICSQGVCAPGGVCSQGGLLQGVSQHVLRQTPPPPWTESQTPVKTLPWPNFVAAGKYTNSSP